MSSKPIWRDLPAAPIGEGVASETLGAVLAQAREAAGLSQVELGEALGLSRWTINRVENGHAYFRVEWILLLPMAVREPVIDYLLRVHEVQTDQLKEWRRPPPIKRPVEQPSA